MRGAAALARCWAALAAHAAAAALALPTAGPDAALTCAALTNLTACPSTPFCCTTGDACIPLTPSGSAVLCCPPDGNGCHTIQPVACDVTLQSQTRNPYFGLHTTDFTAQLATCAGACCPLGYACTDGGQCERKAAHMSTAGGASSTTTATTSAPTATATTPSSDPSSTASSASSKVSAWEILAAVVGGLIAVMVVAIAVHWLLRRCREGRHSADYTRRPPPQPFKELKGDPRGDDGGGGRSVLWIILGPCSGSRAGGAEEGARSPQSPRAHHRPPWLGHSAADGAPARLGDGARPGIVAPPPRPPRNSKFLGAETPRSGTFPPPTPHGAVAGRSLAGAGRYPVNPSRPESRGSEHSRITVGSAVVDERGRGSYETIDILLPPPIHSRGAVLSDATTWASFLQARR